MPCRESRAARSSAGSPSSSGRHEVDREHGRRLGEPVAVDVLPAEALLDRADRRGGRRGAAEHHAHPAVARDGPHPLGGRQHRVGHRGRAARDRAAVLIDAPQDLGAVHLAHHHQPRAHRGERVRQAPAVAVEEGQALQVDVARPHPEVPPDADRVQPERAVGELHALRPGGGARGVVDRGRGVLVGLPRGRARRRWARTARRPATPSSTIRWVAVTSTSASSSSGSISTTSAPLWRTM